MYCKNQQMTCNCLTRISHTSDKRIHTTHNIKTNYLILPWTSCIIYILHIRKIIICCPLGKWLSSRLYVWLQLEMHARMCPSIFASQKVNTRTLRSNAENSPQIPYTNLERFSEPMHHAFRINEVPDNIKAANSVQNFKTQLKHCYFEWN